jgi:hypothetical protein
MGPYTCNINCKYRVSADIIDDVGVKLEVSTMIEENVKKFEMY